MQWLEHAEPETKTIESAVGWTCIDHKYKVNSGDDTQVQIDHRDVGMPVYEQSVFELLIV